MSIDRTPMNSRLQSLTRRQWLQRSSAALGLLALSDLAIVPLQAGNACEDPRLSIGFSLYGMKDHPLETAIPALHRIGYRSVELCLLEGFPTDPQKLTAEQLGTYKRLFDDQQMHVAALMENLPISDRVEVNQMNRDKLRRAAAVAHTLCPKKPPIIETVLGGSKWDQVRDRFVNELMEWAKLAEQEAVTICIKPHRNNALDRPEYVTWLMDRIGSDHLRIVYDYSHFARRAESPPNMQLEANMDLLLRLAPFVHVKDAVPQPDGTVKFGLPGSDPDMNYAEFWKLLQHHHYQGSVCVEVSSQLWKQPGYDALLAAQESFDVLAKAAS